MKNLKVILALLIPLSVSAYEDLRGEATTQVLAETLGAKVQLHIQPDHPRMHIIRDYCTVNISYSDGTNQVLPTFRPTSNAITARIDPKGNKNIALTIQGRLLIHSKDRNESTSISILRDDLIDAAPANYEFRVIDVAWLKGDLFCLGIFRDEAANATSSFPFPFVSKMQVDEAGFPRNHQILWTTWHPRATPNLIPDAWTHKAGTPLLNSLVASDDSLIWRCEGHWQTEHYPSECDLLLERSTWLATNLKTGVTTAAGDSEDQGVRNLIRNREEFILKDLKKKLISPGNLSNKRRFEYLISTFSSIDQIKTDQTSKQGGANQIATDSETNLKGMEKPEPESD